MTSRGRCPFGAVSPTANTSKLLAVMSWYCTIDSYALLIRKRHASFIEFLHVDPSGVLMGQTYLADDSYVLHPQFRYVLEPL
jgi:hypothetical protein